MSTLESGLNGHCIQLVVRHVTVVSKLEPGLTLVLVRFRSRLSDVILILVHTDYGQSGLLALSLAMAVRDIARGLIRAVSMMKFKQEYVVAPDHTVCGQNGHHAQCKYRKFLSIQISKILILKMTF